MFVMKTSPRLEQAISKLYSAFHSDSLNPECCKTCAVGNILNNTDIWKHLTDGHGSLKLSYVGKVNEALGKKLNGYTPFELLQIESAFLKGCGYKLPLSHKTNKLVDRNSKEVMFNGMCEAVAVLCKLDGISNVMDYSRLFDFEDNQPVNELAYTY